MQPCTSINTKSDRWIQLEEEVSRLCQNEKRTRETILAVEDQDEVLDLVLRDRSTGAILTAESIKSHLYHFCNTLPKQPFVDTSPDFSIKESSPNKGPGLLTARVALPNCIGSFRRSYLAAGEYRTERAATMAAAYQCYGALHRAELVNNNFLPSILKIQERCRNLPPILEVDEHIQPWRLMAHAWSSPTLYKTSIHLESNPPDDRSSLRISFITPMSIPPMSLRPLKQHTCITMKQTCASVLSFAGLERLRQRMAELCSSNESQKDHIANRDFVYIFDFDDGRDFRSPPAPNNPHKIMTQIVGQVEKFMIAGLLQTSILPTCTFHNAEHIVTALTAPSADAQLNFERYEFLGDAVLKMVVSAQVLTDHVIWPAGWLSQYRDNLISNASLANAALSLHLDQYILTRAPRTRNWTLPRLSDADCLPEKRILSSKTLADVSQALFAAAYLDTGHGLARSCIKIFIPEIRSEQPTFEMPHGAKFPRHEVEEIQQLIGHQFRNFTVLLQALTHPSCTSHGSEESYQRLAFLGDAVLGFLVAKTLFQHPEELSEGKMTKVRAAVVNSNMLGYVCMTHSIPRKVFGIETTTLKQSRKVQRVENMPLWKYMRHESKYLGKALDACNARYRGLCGCLHQQMQNGHSYPWVTLAELQPEGFYSDLVQSVIGAIYVDSGGEWSACQQFIETIGISSSIQRMVQPDYDVAHPRSVLQQLSPLAEVRSHLSDGVYKCSVTVDDVEIASAESYKGRGEASILASHRAVQILARAKNTEGPLCD
ncbi:ribonuclease III domain-containing protein [Paraphoma chrysanthemicola]|nr:ribonuclease III domain-containing protein [Paraphoma chrysanthemicola]